MPLFWNTHTQGAKYIKAKICLSQAGFILETQLKVEAIWFGCYGVIIWFLSGKNESEWFLLFSMSDIVFALFVCAIFSVRFTQIYYHVTKELCAWLITRYTFRAHCWVIYQRTIMQDANVFWKTKISSNFAPKLSVFVFFMKSNMSTPCLT